MLTVKYNPNDFKDVIGNENAISILKNLLLKGEDCPHVFLFSGDFGCGKSSLANIMANKLNAKDFNIKVYNSSLQRGIDTIREIEVQCKFIPYDGSNKTFILEESHKILRDSQEALLKILENPPYYVYFMLTTTNPEKLLEPLKSRCVLINIEKIEKNVLLKYLEKICKLEKKIISIDVLKKIVNKSEQHVRNALILLETIMDIKGEEKQIEIIKKYIVSEEDENILNLCRALIKNNNWEEVRKILKDLDIEPDGCRRAILGYFSSVLLNANNSEMRDLALMVLRIFKNDYLSSGKSGLIADCCLRYKK